ncbi:MAG: right-handed parallel beta-helix repeat-containing protein [Rhodopirellula sp.]|nr:right-handed parallel beta-helix repeat-containing protein [Rhodopirellula sp.]
MPRSVCRFAVVCLILGLPLAAAAREVYVAKSGDDANPGTREKPLASVLKAVEAMRGAGPGTIWIGEGEYYVEKSLAFDAEHTGTAEQPLVLRGTEPGKVRLTGARAVGDLRPITADEAHPLVSTEAKQHVLVADLKAQGFPPLGPLPEKHRDHGLEEIVFGDRPMQSARWPNEGFVEFDKVIDSGASGVTHWVSRDVYRPGSFEFPGERAKLWDFQRGVWLHGFWCYEWSDEVLKAASYNPGTGELRLAAKHAYGVGSPWRKDSKHEFYALHVFEELDRPGEYYLDRQNNLLYFWPPADVTNTPLRLTLCRQPLIRANGSAYLTVRDLTVENGCDAGIVMSNCRHVRVENCLIRNLGRSGISLSGSNMAAVGCEVTEVGSSGISVHGGDRKTLTPGECSIENCHVHHVGRLNWEGGRAAVLGGCGNRMANNLFHHGPTGAVSYGGNEHVLELNEAHDMCIHYADVGVFYTGRDWASRGNLVRWNYIHDVAVKGGSGAQAIYLDDCDSGETVVGNIVYRCGNRGVLLGGGRDNAFRGNIFIDQPIGIHVDARGPRGIVFDRPDSWNLLAKCEQLGYQSPLWTERYPRLARIMEEAPLQPKGNSMHANIMIGCKQPFDLKKGVDPAWLDRADNAEWPLTEFPELLDGGPPTRLNLSKLPAIGKKVAGFEPIPIERIGLGQASK